MTARFLNNDNYITFQRSRNPIKSLWYFFKNGWIIANVKITFSIIILFVVFLLCLILFFIITGTSAKNASLYYIVIFLLIVIFALLELVVYFLITKFSKIYRLDKIVLRNKDIIVFPCNKSPYRVLYQDIWRLCYSSQIKKIIISQFFSNIFFRSIFYFKCFVIEFKDNIGSNHRLFIPLDLINLPEFLHILIEKSELKKVQSQKLNPFFEWRKSQIDEKFEMSQTQNLRPSVIDPNKDIGKLILVVLIITIFISYLIIKFLM